MSHNYFKRTYITFLFKQVYGLYKNVHKLITRLIFTRFTHFLSDQAFIELLLETLPHPHVYVLIVFINCENVRKHFNRPYFQKFSSFKMIYHIILRFSGLPNYPPACIVFHRHTEIVLNSVQVSSLRCQNVDTGFERSLK